MPAKRTTTRAVLALGILLGVIDFVSFPLLSPQQIGLATEVYTYAAEALLAGENFYAVSPPGLEGYRFVYPPVVALAFLPYGLIGSTAVAFAVQTAINVAAALGVAWLVAAILDSADVDLGRLDHVLLAGFSLLSIHAVVSVVNGQVNLVLAALIGGGVFAVERDRERVGGAALAAAATVKLFPALLGVYLLRISAWRAVVAAVATGVGLLAFGVVALGVGPLETYLTTTLPAEMQTGALIDRPAEVGFATVRRPLAALFPGIGPELLPVVGFAILAPIVAAHYRRVDSLTDRLVAVNGTLVATLLWLPTEPIYFPLVFVPFVSLLYLLEGQRIRGLFLGGAVLTYVKLTPGAAETYLSALPVDPSLAAALGSMAEAAFRIVLPSAIGMWLLLAAGVLYQFRDGTPTGGVAAGKGGCRKS